MGIQKKYWFLLLVIIIFTTLISQCTSFPYAEDLLTPEEKQWLSEHDGTIVLAPEKNYPPLSYVDEEGARKGISAEYIRFIEERLDFSFAVAPPDNLAAILNNAGARDVDVIRSLKKTPERSETLLFTELYRDTDRHYCEKRHKRIVESGRFQGQEGCCRGRLSGRTQCLWRG